MLFRSVDVDRVHVMVGGRVVREGGPDLVDWIDRHGFESFE